MLTTNAKGAHPVKEPIPPSHIASPKPIFSG